MSDIARRIAENLAAVRDRIADAARRAGRPSQSVRLVAITKYFAADAARALAEAGCIELGESRPQELWAKAESLDDLPIRWHMVGHLQRNKVRRTLPLAAWIQSVDSIRLAAAIDQAAAELGCRPSVLLEVNISGERAKHGFLPEEMERILPELAGLEHVGIRGLMGMASLEGGLEAARRDFARLRALRDRLRALGPAGLVLDELSMGMSGDYEVAIEEGATVVRVGSALFEGLAP